MTLLFFLRSSNGSTAPANTTIDEFFDDVPLEPFKKKRKEGTVKQFEYDRKVRKRKEEEDLLLLLLKEDYDD